MKQIRFIFILLASGLLFGCASPANVDEMAAKETTTMVFDESFKKSIKLEKVGNIGVQYGLIKTEDFELALFKSLKNLDLIAINKAPDYELSAQFMDAEQPIFGADFEVNSKIKYVLIENKTQKVLIKKVISAPYTATMSDALIAATRLRLANEGSVRMNIMSFLETLSALDTKAE
ncbi:hypothetical protein [Moritella sp.]|jgi:hypothetical protein|uniref:hypothetical protein n=1 Tax=Moritella sp. TaxID=78556 RepID=UPI001DFD012C|nr:hypothetical protein [Moritella sp.]MCJ8349386.1 hypothetical protein [Moritella sp.]NQZ39297.1 hypothetical protein [Moritella sp.]